MPSGRRALTLEQVLEHACGSRPWPCAGPPFARCRLAVHHRAPVPIALDDVGVIDGDEGEPVLDVVVRRIAALLEHALDEPLGGAAASRGSLTKRDFGVTPLLEVPLPGRGRQRRGPGARRAPARRRSSAARPCPFRRPRRPRRTPARNEPPAGASGADESEASIAQDDDRRDSCSEHDPFPGLHHIPPSCSRSGCPRNSGV